MKKMILMVFVFALFGLGQVVKADDSHYVEKGEIYIEGLNNTYTAAVRIPTTKPYSILTITPKPDPDAAGTSVVGSWDFILKDAATGSTVNRYWRFSETLMPMQLIGYEFVYTKGAYISNTPTAANCDVGQWFEWYTEILAR